MWLRQPFPIAGVFLPGLSFYSEEEAFTSFLTTGVTTVVPSTPPPVVTVIFVGVRVLLLS